VENWPSICIRHFVDAFGARVTKFLSISLDAAAPLSTLLCARSMFGRYLCATCLSEMAVIRLESTHHRGLRPVRRFEPSSVSQ